MGLKIAVGHIQIALEFGEAGLAGTGQEGGKLGAQGLVEKGVEGFHGRWPAPGGPFRLLISG
jgi:hypothetical protein